MSFLNKCLLVFVATLLLICSSRLLAVSLPDFDDVNRLSRRAKQISDDFFENSFEIRMRYEYAEGFTDPDDKANLSKLAIQASADLEQIANDQNNLKKQIEDYQGDDWETRFGQTGLWRRLTAELQKTKSSKLEIDFYSSIAGGEKAECPPFAVRSSCAAVKASMEKIRCFGLSGPNELNALEEQLSKSECSNDKEMLLMLAILQRRYSPDDFQKLPSRNPQAAIEMGKLLLRELSSQFKAGDVNFASFSSFDVELAVTASMQAGSQYRRGEGPQQYADLIMKLSEIQKFQNPVILYVSASLCEQTNPKKAVEMLIKASNLQSSLLYTTFLNSTPEEIARRAFEIAYQEFQADQNACQPAIIAFENYSRIASEKTDEQSQYLYGDLLKNCNRTDEAAKAFERLARRSQSFWGDAATLELLKIDLYKGRDPNESLAGLRDFILGCKRPEEREIQLRFEAMDLYCRTLLQCKSSDSAQKVLEILDAALPTQGLPYELYRAMALHQLGRLEESINFMRKAIDDNDCSTAPQIFSLLSEILDKIELWQQDARDFNQMLLDCAALADFADKCLNIRQANLILAEFTILQGKRYQKPFPTNNENDTTRLRVMARHTMAEGNYNQAAKLWADAAELRRNETAGNNKKSYGWWQAKFYELECLSKMPAPNKAGIIHTIEVLQHTYSDIPAPWAEKLNRLAANLSNPLKGQLQDNTN
ncbi:MAG: hypothetical protein JW749_07645 [Sedimentisphaerales bacterium]|nr:hypothetical protein [Sedimentisphaerales bacterium]